MIEYRLSRGRIVAHRKVPFRPLSRLGQQIVAQLEPPFFLGSERRRLEDAVRSYGLAGLR